MPLGSGLLESLRRREFKFGGWHSQWRITPDNYQRHSYGKPHKRAVTFNVQGLVLVGGNASGTPDGVTSVKGTLVCDPMRTESLSTRLRFH